MTDYKTDYSRDKNVNTLDRGSYDNFGDGTPAKQVIARQADNEIFSTSSFENNILLKQLINKLGDLERAIQYLNTKRLIEDAQGSGIGARVNSLGAIKVNNQNIPDLTDPNNAIPITGFLVDANGSIDARVDGSVTPIDFSIKATQNSDIYLNALSFKLADANAQLNEWGSIGVLNVGFDLIYSTQDLGERILATGIRTSFDLIRLCQADPAFSQGVESFRASNVVAGAEGYLPNLKFESFGLPFGIRLKRNTFDKLILRVNDNVTGVDAFDIFYYGTEII